MTPGDVYDELDETREEERATGFSCLLGVLTLTFAGLAFALWLIDVLSR